LPDIIHCPLFEKVYWVSETDPISKTPFRNTIRRT